jgi:hypothetical protein
MPTAERLSASDVSPDVCLLAIYEHEFADNTSLVEGLGYTWKRRNQTSMAAKVELCSISAFSGMPVPGIGGK